MEKFTVDLDKVLDDFEFNEDKAEQLASVAPKKQSTQPAGRVKQAVTPYRRPQFEPINLAEADFAAAPERSFQSSWQGSKPVEQAWQVKNNEPADEDMDSDEDSDIEGDDTYKIPKNVNESLNFYQNNSFQDEFLENKPIPVGRPISFPDPDTKWQPKSQNIHDSSDSFSSGKSNVSGGSASLNEYVNSGAKVVVKDVKTVSNNLSSNKLTNHDKSAVIETRTSIDREEDRNLPDVASTSKTVPSNVVTNVPNNTMFDLVTNICNDQDQSSYDDKSLPPFVFGSALESILSNLAISGEELESESRHSHVFKPYETRVPTVSSNKEAWKGDKGTESSSSDDDFDPSHAAESSQNVDFSASSATPKPVVSFGDVDHLSDSDLLNYLQEIEDEENLNEESKVKDDNVKVASLVTGVQKLIENFTEGKDSREEDKLPDIPVAPTDGGIATTTAATETAAEERKAEATEVGREERKAEVTEVGREERKAEATEVGREEWKAEATEERRTASNTLKEIVFEMSLPECSRSLVEEQQVAERPGGCAEQDGADEPCAASIQPEAATQGGACELRGDACEDSSPEDEESMEDRAYVGVSAETGSLMQLRPDRDRPGMLVDEVRTPMIQSPHDGSNIHVLGEEERPTRPKYLLLSTPATATEQTVGDAGATPPAPPANINAMSQNLINASLDQLTDQSQADLDNANTVADQADESSLVETPTALTPDARPYEDPLTPDERGLGKLPPFWIPDADALACMLCEARFTVIKRRHHCRACGKVLCAKCCGLRFSLEYMDNTEGRVCHPCHDILVRVLLDEQGESATGSPHTPLGRQPNPNNPMEYCSVIPPLQQEAGGGPNPPCVLVPVLKREGSTRAKGEGVKQVMFSDGIRPGGDLTELDGSAEPRLPFRRPGRVAKRVATPPGPNSPSAVSRTLPPLNPGTLSYLPQDTERRARALGPGSSPLSSGLPPIATIVKGDLKLEEDALTPEQLLATLTSDTDPPVMFAINRNLFVNVKVLNLSCCVNHTCWCFSTLGLSCVGQDEVLLVLEKPEQETTIPTDVFSYINTLYQDAVRGSTVSELGCTLLTGPFLGSNDHGAFVYVRPSFQCLNQLVLPPAPYLVALLVHRSETPWARVFPIRLVLRLGAESRYYPCSLVSMRCRKPVYREIGHTIVNLLADFRNLTYTLPPVRGLVIHMEDRQTSVLVPRNRYDQVTRALNNSNEHVLAFAANLSLTADSHLVCVQSDNDDSYHTQAINIHSKPRRVTGASFVVFNGALRTSSNLTAKSSIVEDGLMVQITPDTMLALRAALRNMKDLSIGCGPTGATTPDEVVKVKWVDDDVHFNVGVASVIDGRGLDGVPSIRVHNGTDYLGRTRLVRWTEVFILRSEEGGGGGRTEEPLDVGRLSEQVARAACHALVELLDLLAQAGYCKLAVRATVHPDNVGYEVGSRGEKLPPIYMNSLDNELVPVLHAAAAANQHTDAILELIFHVLLQ